jgi:hypothetical protein
VVLVPPSVSNLHQQHPSPLHITAPERLVCSPTRVQIVVLTLFPEFSSIYRRYALSGKRCSLRRRGAIGDFGNLQICLCSVLRRYSLGWGLRTCIHRGERACVVSVCVVLCHFKKKNITAPEKCERKRRKTAWTILQC